MEVVGVIPARLASTRLPRKLILSDTGRTLIEHTWANAIKARSLSKLMIATDSEEIRAVVESFGGLAVMTREHASGTDRIAEVAEKFCPDTDFIVNIQGDEPELDPRSIDRLVEVLNSDDTADMATLATPIRHREELDSPSCVKVVLDQMQRALYFSRCPIPFVRDRDPEQPLPADSPWLLHLGIYAYRRDFLLSFSRWAPGRLEQLEKLEQLRALEHGGKILVEVVEQRTVGIDTPDDYARFVARQSQRN